MKLFRYAMENVLDYRKDVEEEEKQKFAEVRRKYMHQKKVLDEFKDKIDLAESSQSAKPTYRISELKNRYQYLHYLKEKTEIQENLVSETEKVLEARRQQLISAQKDRKMMEKHKEKTQNRYQIDMDLLEQKSIDELALYSHMRK